MAVGAEPRDGGVADTTVVPAPGPGLAPASNPVPEPVVGPGRQRQPELAEPRLPVGQQQTGPSNEGSPFIPDAEARASR